MVERLKAFLAMLLGAAFCFFWPVFLGSAFVPVGVFFGLFLWPLGAWFLFKAFRFEEGPSIESVGGPTSHAVEVNRTQDVYEDNYRALLDWKEATSPDAPRSSHHDFARSLATSFGSRRWSGDNLDPMFAAGSDQYLDEYWSAPPKRITLSEIEEEAQLASGALKTRFRQAPNNRITRLYRATDRGDEVAFVAVDFPAAEQVLVLYELYVSPSRQREGLGTAVLRAVEDLAWASNRRRVVLWPRQIDPSGMSDEQLTRWYLSRGYSPLASDSDRLEKNIV